MSRLTLLAVVVALLAGCATGPVGPEARRLSDAEIRGLFQGSSFILVGMKSGNELLAYAEGESCTMRYVDGEVTKTVRWFVRDGMHCCVRKGKEECGPIYDVGQGVYHKVTDGRHSHTMKQFSEGNRL
ncbi:MAG: hypothetical protein ACQETD_09070 [Pseudomonadota bacterium]